MEYKYEIKISPLAAHDLIQIFDYIKNTLYAEKAAENLIQKIMKQIELLEKSPEMYPALNNPLFIKKGYRKIVVNNYVLIYSVDYSKKKVNVVRAYYGASDYEKLL